jgi:hypothetical protein
MDITVYKRVTDVQATWKSFGWSPPSEDPEIKAKWQFYRTLDTGGSNETSRLEPSDGYAFRIDFNYQGKIDD